MKIPLSQSHPELAKTWHNSINGPFTPEWVTADSTNKYWWMCPKVSTHFWMATPRQRRLSPGSPLCECRASPLSKIDPEIASWLHPEFECHADTLPANAVKKVQWRCPRNPEHGWWRTVVKQRKSRKCPFCLGKKVCGENSLAATHPHLLTEWHPDKNKTLNPHMLLATSPKKVWWICPKAVDHEWQAAALYRAKGAGCPFCTNRKVCKTNSLTYLHPSLAREWHPTKNGDLTPEDVVPGSNKKAWWLCKEDEEHA